MSLLGQNIRKAREAKGWTQDQLAEATGKSGKQIVSLWESGKSKPGTKTLIHIAQLLDTTVDALTFGAETKPYSIPDDKVLIAKEEYIKYLSWKNTQQEAEIERLRKSGETADKH
jgi:transcriptional regulator with XRE-family HTH domain